jgi:hypothetical protein
VAASADVGKKAGTDRPGCWSGDGAISTIAMRLFPSRASGFDRRPEQ